MFFASEFECNNDKDDSNLSKVYAVISPKIQMEISLVVACLKWKSTMFLENYLVADIWLIVLEIFNSLFLCCNKFYNSNFEFSDWVHNKARLPDLNLQLNTKEFETYLNWIDFCVNKPMWCKFKENLSKFSVKWIWKFLKSQKSLNQCT